MGLEMERVRSQIRKGLEDGSLDVALVQRSEVGFKRQSGDLILFLRKVCLLLSLCPVPVISPKPRSSAQSSIPSMWGTSAHSFLPSP